MTIDPSLLAVLACPKCKSPVIEKGEWLECQSPSCGLSYPVKDGIPVMLIDEAKPKGAR